jgi:dipeptidyl-peptidase 9
VTFIWSSEETGFRHLYLVTSSLTEATSMSHQLNGGSANFSNKDSMPLKCDTLVPRIINKVALTSGNWEVLGRNIWVDRCRQIVYFLGLKETPLEKHLYAVSLQKPDWCRLLTVKGFSYTVEFNDVICLLAPNAL